MAERVASMTRHAFEVVALDKALANSHNNDAEFDRNQEFNNISMPKQGFGSVASVCRRLRGRVLMARVMSRHNSLRCEPFTDMDDSRSISNI